MSTEQVLLEARLALATVRSNELVNAIILLVGFAALVLFGTWVLDRWSWIPRKRQRRVFIEKF